MKTDQITNTLIENIKHELESIYFGDLRPLVYGAYQYAEYDVYHSDYRDRYTVDEIDRVWNEQCKPFIDCVAKIIDERVEYVHVYGTEGIMVGLYGSKSIDEPCVIDYVDWVNETITIKHDLVASYVQSQINDEALDQGSILDCFVNFWREIRS